MKPDALAPERVAVPTTSFLGAAEVRDMSKVPAQQLVAFPRRTAGQVRALDQVAGSRLRWRVTPGRDAYLTFTPLGSQGPCPSNYRVGLKAPGERIQELFASPVAPVGPIAPAAVEVSLADWTGQEIEIFLQIDPLSGPIEGLVPGAEPPRALWASPAVVDRGEEGPAARLAEKATDRRPNVVLVGFDTLRADAVGAWGRNPSLTPTLDALAAESDVWLDAYSTFNVTNPSFVSIMTGLYGKDHGVYDLQTPLPPGPPTLAGLFARAGYDTLAVVSARHLGHHNSGLGRGFAKVTEASEHLSAEMAVDEVLDWLAAREQRGDRRPFFVWLHLFDPHTPHTPPLPFANGMRPSAPAGLSPVSAWLAFRTPGPRPFAEPVLGGEKDLYDGEVAYLDRQTGRLVDFLASRGLLDASVLALVSDHGENLTEHGVRFRHVGLFDTTTHVPMMIRWPGKERQGRRLGGLVQTIDLFPTLLAAAGLEAPASDGADLRKLADEGGSKRRAVFAEHAGRLGVMVRSRTHKYMLSTGNTRFLPDGAYLYDLAADPGETVNLAGHDLPAEREMRSMLARWLAARRPVRKAVPRDLSAEDVERLKALGYQ